MGEQCLKGVAEGSVGKIPSGGGRRWIKKAVNVITLTLMAVDKGGGGKTLIHQRWINYSLFFLKSSHSENW